MISQYLQLIEEPVIDDSMTRFEYTEYQDRDSNNINKQGQRVLETKDMDAYLLPHKAFLEVRGRLQTNALANYAVGDAVTLVNNGWSLFESAQYQVNNQTVEDISLHLPQTSTIMNLIIFSDDYSRSTATNMFWFRDTGNGSADQNEFVGTATLLPVAAVANDGNVTGASSRGINFNNMRSGTYNKGFATRRLFTGDKEKCMYLPLSS